MTKKTSMTTLDYDVDIKKVKFLEGKAKKLAKDTLRYQDEDRVVIRSSFNSFPKYSIERIEGDEMEFMNKLKNRKGQIKWYEVD